VLFITDVPHGDLEDYDQWHSRRQMAEEWRRTFDQLGNKVEFKVLPMLTYPATATIQYRRGDDGILCFSSLNAI